LPVPPPAPKLSGVPDGGFSWVGLLTSDIESATSFYGDLFGWEAGEGDRAG
jgi:predicted enzyme related to lactoylglutathione lyase